MLVSGRTGVGKSTLLGVLTGLVPRFSGGTLTGDVLIDGVSVIDQPPRERAHVVGYVGQDPVAGFVTDTVEEELAYGMEQLGLPGDTMRRRVEETLDLLGIADLRHRDLRTLSGGQQQRVAIGAVLTTHPRLLVLDEPTSALDPTAAEDVLATLTRLVHDLGLTVLLAEHRLERVVPFADRICLLTGDGGVLVGSPADVLAVSPVVPPIIELGRAAGWSPLPLSVRDARRSARGLGPAPPPAIVEPPDGSTVLSARGLTVAHGRNVVLRGVDLDLRSGHVTALMGRNGAGQVDADLGAAGHAGAPLGHGRASRTRTRAGSTPPAVARSSGWSRRPPPTCSTSRRWPRSARPPTPAPASRTARCRGLLDRLVPGIDDDDAPARPVRGAATGAGAGDRAGCPAPRRAPRRAHPRPRLHRQGRARADRAPTWPTTGTPC